VRVRVVQEVDACLNAKQGAIEWVDPARHDCRGVLCARARAREPALSYSPLQQPSSASKGSPFCFEAIPRARETLHHLMRKPSATRRVNFSPPEDNISFVQKFQTGQRPRSPLFSFIHFSRLHSTIVEMRRKGIARASKSPIRVLMSFDPLT